MTPLIYVSYGMAKSGSTLAFRLVSAVLEQAGLGQEDVDLRPLIQGADRRFVEVIRPRELAALREIAEARGRIVAVKTHSGLWDCVLRGLEEGWIAAHAVARDPRDVALSMMDAARQGRGWGGRTRPYGGIEETAPVIRAQVEKFQKWAAAPNVLPLAYEPIAFGAAGEAARIAAQLGLTVDAEAAAKAALAAGTNLNVGRPRRHRQEMAPVLSEAFAAEFGEFIRRWCAPDFAPPAPPRRGLLPRLGLR